MTNDLKETIMVDWGKKILKDKEQWDNFYWCYIGGYEISCSGNNNEPEKYPCVMTPIELSHNDRKKDELFCVFVYPDDFAV